MWKVWIQSAGISEMYEREISGSGWSIVIKAGKKLKWKNWSRPMFYSGWLQVRGKCQEMGQSRLCVFLFGFLLGFFLLLDFFFIERYWTTKRRKKNYPMKFSYCHLGSKLWTSTIFIVEIVSGILHSRQSPNSANIFPTLFGSREREISR